MTSNFQNFKNNKKLLMVVFYIEFLLKLSFKKKKTVVYLK